MKKLIIVACLALIAVVVAPVASASAAFTGTCTIHGTAEFFNELKEPTKLKPGPAKPILEYRFTSDQNGVGTKCIKAGTKKAKEATATVTGKFEGNCETATSLAPGKGELTVKGEATAKFELTFTAAAGNVALKIW